MSKNGVKKLLAGITIGLSVVSCAAPPAPAVVATLTLETDGAVSIGIPEQVKVTLKDIAGNVITGRTVTWTSSNPSQASVDSNGMVTARHLSLSRAPVIINATSEGVSSTASLTTYGLDIAGGFVSDNTTAIKALTVQARFQGPTGQGVPVDTDVILKGPGGQAYSPARLFQSSSQGGYLGSDQDVATDGLYTGTAVVNGATYTKTFTVDLSRVLGFVTNPSVSVVGNSLRLQGTAPADTMRLKATVYNQSSGYVTAVSTPAANSGFDTTLALEGTPNPGGYASGMYAYDYSATTDLLPDTIRVSFTGAQNVTFP